METTGGQWHLECCLGGCQTSVRILDKLLDRFVTRDSAAFGGCWSCRCRSCPIAKRRAGRIPRFILLIILDALRRLDIQGIVSLWNTAVSIHVKCDAHSLPAHTHLHGRTILPPALGIGMNCHRETGRHVWRSDLVDWRNNNRGSREPLSDLETVLVTTMLCLTEDGS